MGYPFNQFGTVHFAITDRVAILGKVIPDLREAARAVLRSLDSQGRA